jgi:hypothetical protein
MVPLITWPFSLRIFEETMHSPVGVTTSYRIDDPGSIFDRGRFSLFHSVKTGSVGPPSLLYNGYWGQSGRSVKLTTHFHLVLYFHSPTDLHAIGIKK